MAHEPSLEELTKHLGIAIDTEVLRLALTHSSYAFEHGVDSNERLEFLGDSILGMVVAEYLFRTYPEHAENDLSKMRSSIVSQRPLAFVARKMGLGHHIRLGKGEVVTHGEDKDSILEDTVESLIGAAYVTRGFAAAKFIVDSHIIPLLKDESVMGAGKDWKTIVKVAADDAGLGEIEYETDSVGPDHNRQFSSVLLIGGVEYGTGQASTKKKSMREAAWNSWPKIQKAVDARTS